MVGLFIAVIGARYLSINQDLAKVFERDSGGGCSVRYGEGTF